LQTGGAKAVGGGDAVLLGEEEGPHEPC
jgi:hypothetical protein